jgi:hypothetical protein
MTMKPTPSEALERERESFMDVYLSIYLSLPKTLVGRRVSWP